VMIIPLGIVVISLFLLFFAGWITKTERLSNLPIDRPWFFIYAPRMLASLSGMFWLEFATLRRFEAIVLRGEGRMWFNLFFFSILPQDLRKHENAEKQRHIPSNFLKRCFVRIPDVVIKLMASVMYVALFLISFQSLLVKMTALHFATIVGFTEWDIHHWILFMGFVNQVSGAVTMEEEELSRLFLFIYGGSNAKWDQTEFLAVAEFMSLVAEKVIVGKIGEEKGCLAAISVLSSFEANQLQRLLLCPLRENRIIQGMDQRHQMLEHLNVSDETNKVFLKELFDAQDLHQDGDTEGAATKLKKAKDKRINFLKKERDSLLDHARDDSLPDTHNTPQSATIKLAAEVQDYIEDVVDLEFSDHAEDVEEMDDVECDSDSGDEESFQDLSSRAQLLTQAQPLDKIPLTTRQ